MDLTQRTKNKTCIRLMSYMTEETGKRLQEK